MWSTMGEAEATGLYIRRNILFQERVDQDRAGVTMLPIERICFFDMGAHWQIVDNERRRFQIGDEFDHEQIVDVTLGYYPLDRARPRNARVVAFEKACGRVIPGTVEFDSSTQALIRVNLGKMPRHLRELRTWLTTITSKLPPSTTEYAVIVECTQNDPQPVLKRTKFIFRNGEPIVLLEPLK